MPSHHTCICIRYTYSYTLTCEDACAYTEMCTFVRMCVHAMHVRKYLRTSVSETVCECTVSMYVRI